MDTKLDIMTYDWVSWLLLLCCPPNGQCHNWSSDGQKHTTEKSDLEIGDSSACINGQNRIDPMGKTTLEKFTPAGTSRTKVVGQNHNEKADLEIG